MKIGKKVKVVPYTENRMQITYFENVGHGIVEVYANSENKFVQVDVKNFNDTVYTQGVDLMIENYKLLHNPSLKDENLKTLVEASRELELMVPATSFIVVERSSQWKTLELKEKQRLNASAGLEFEDDFNTPAPSFWLMSAILFLWFFMKNKIKLVFKSN